jgi:HK97 family phage portal protein
MVDLALEHLSLDERIRERDRLINLSVRRSLRKRPTRMLSDDPVLDAVNRRIPSRPKVWQPASVQVALGVPAIQRAVSLISSTVGMLSMQGYRNGVVMDGMEGRPDSPRLVVRPDPDQTPYAFYSGTAANMAKYGEFVWWIPTRDNDGLPAALVNVPLRELLVQMNWVDRRRPIYRWGTVEGTRYSPANPTGNFVHVVYPLGEPYALRGLGPLQLGNAAVSVSVEAQEWAANFYGTGGYPREVIKHAGELDPTRRDDQGLPDAEGLSEAERLKADYMYRDNNTPMVIDQRIESITTSDVNPQGAQMLEARLHQNGEAARMFGISGHWVEYVQRGTSLTYQNLEMAFTELIKVCVQPLYLEPIEQTITDLLTRSTTARFNVKGFLRADVKTRYEVHQIAIQTGVYDAAYAQREEGILPGDVEYAPVPAAQPAAIPPSIPNVGTVLSVRCPKCNKFLAKSLGSGSELDCPRCKAEVRVA